jgi:hypothetical protein
VAQQIENLLKARLLHAVLGEEHAHMGDGEGAGEFREHRHQLLGQPAWMQEIELPAELGAACAEPFDARPHRGGEAGRWRLHRRDVDPHPAHPHGVHLGEQRVRRVFVDIDDAAAACDSDLAHGIEHASVVAAIGARLHEHESLEAELRGEREIVGERRKRRNVAQRLVHPAVRVALRRTEHVKMCIARQRWRAEGGWRLVWVAQRVPPSLTGAAVLGLVKVTELG